MIRTIVRKTVLLLAVLACGVGVSGCLMSVEREIALGKQAAPEFEAQGGGRYPSELAQDYVHSVGSKLVDELTPEERRTYEFSFTLLNSSIVNAFALPGGPIYITRGLLVKMDSEDELAGVLGHEIGHVVRRHTATRIQRAMGFQVLLFLVNIGVQVTGGPPVLTDVSNLVLQLTDLKYGRDDESESDWSGTEYLVRAGYDPRGMVQVMRVLQASGGGGSIEFFSTHPNPENRLQAIQERIAKDWPRVLEHEPKFNRAPFQKMLTDSLLVAKGSTRYAAFDAGEKLYVDALRALQNGDKTTANSLLARAEQRYTVAINSLQGHASPYRGRALVRWRLGRLDEALRDLDKALEVEKNHHAARVTRARLRLEANNNAGALKDIEYALRRVPFHPLSYFYRGKANYRLKNNESAIDDLQKFLGTQPSGPESAEARTMLKALGG